MNSVGKMDNLGRTGRYWSGSSRAYTSSTETSAWTLYTDQVDNNPNASSAKVGGFSLR